jgi:hypothetical protein
VWGGEREREIGLTYLEKYNFSSNIISIPTLLSATKQKGVVG